MMRRDIVWFMFCAALVAGNVLWANQLIHESSQNELRKLSSIAKNSQQSVAPRCNTNINVDLLAAEVSRTVAATLADSKGAVVPDGDEDENDQVAQLAEHEREAPSDEAVEAYDASHKLIEAGMSRGVWTRDDVMALRPQISMLDDDLRGELLIRLMDAVNDGKMKIDGVFGPPY